MTNLDKVREALDKGRPLRPRGQKRNGRRPEQGEKQMTNLAGVYEILEGIRDSGLDGWTQGRAEAALVLLEKHEKEVKELKKVVCKCEELSAYLLGLDTPRR